MTVQSKTQRRGKVDLIYGSEAPADKRNPYLVDFEKQRSRKQGGQGRQGRLENGYSQSAGGWDEDEQDWREQEEFSRTRRVHTQQRQEHVRQRNTETGREKVLMAGNGRTRALPEDSNEDRVSRQQAARRAARARRRRRVLMQRMLVGTWIVCIFVLAVAFVFKNNRASAEGDGENGGAAPGREAEAPQYSGIMVQGLPAEEYAKHPAWTEDFLTPNEYSRPGDALERVDSIFVHYTANPGTSAAQNRSYFDGLKDTHETSASAHFIIGYEGEIIQCVPLDEIAYAVQSRNFDSVSIECCYLAQDGSFTQETYDSLISLLAWLTDAYKLDTEDILRHYDCGGKKCPLYYTEHPDAWEELKKDVDKL